MATRMASSSAFLLPRNLSVRMVGPSYSTVPGARSSATMTVAKDTTTAAASASSLRMGLELVGEDAIDHADDARHALGELDVVGHHHQRHAALAVELYHQRV